MNRHAAAVSLTGYGTTSRWSPHALFAWMNGSADARRDRRLDRHLLAKSPSNARLAAVRVGLLGDDFVPQPQLPRRSERSELDLVVAATPSGG